MRNRSILLALLVLGHGCGREGERTPPPAAEQAPTRPVVDDIATKRLLVEIDANATKQCRRPVLHGEPEPGSADKDARSIFEGDESLAGCLDAATEDADLASISTKCETVVARVREAVAHEDACFPYLPGRNPYPASLLPLIRASRGLVAVARARATEAPADALGLLLDGARFSQDMARGEVTWLEAMLSIAASTIVLDEAHRLLRARPSLTTDDVAELRRRIAVLRSTEPHPIGVLAGDRRYVQLYHLLPSISPPGWVPPGGWPPDAPATPPSPPDEVPRILSAWHALDDLAADQLDACPPTASVASCVEGLDALDRRAQEASDPRKAMLELLDHAGGDAETRATIKAIATGSWDRYVKRMARRPSSLQALDIALAQLGAPECPKVSALGGVDEHLGVALVATAVDGGIELRMPEALAEEEPRTWTIACGTAGG